MKYQPYYLQTFIGEGASGGPTAVYLMPETPDSASMLRLAREAGVAVTAFLFPANIDGTYGVRYSTAVKEIAACGHATLAAAQLAFEITGLRHIVFSAPQGPLPVTINGNGLIEMQYPRYGTEPFIIPGVLLRALGLESCISPDYCTQLQTLFLETEPATLRNLQPDFDSLKKSSHIMKEVVVTSVSDKPGYDYLFRSFCPWMGMDEDPATGSVHGVLAHYWQHRNGRQQMKAYQASACGAVQYVTAGNNCTIVSGYAAPVQEALQIK